MKKLIEWYKKNSKIFDLITESKKETGLINRRPTEEALIAKEKLKKYSKKEQNKAELVVFLVSFLPLVLMVLILLPIMFIVTSNTPQKESKQEYHQEEKVSEENKFKGNCQDVVNLIDKSSSLKEVEDKIKENNYYSIDYCNENYKTMFGNSKLKKPLEKLKEKEQKQLEDEKSKNEKAEKEAAEKQKAEEKQKNIESCKNNGGQWLDYSNKCKTKAEIEQEKESYRKDCLNKTNYTWDGNSCIGKEWFWQGNDRSLYSDSRVSSNESKIVNEVFNAVERKSKSAYVLDSGDGKPWTVTIKMNGDSLSDYTVVFYIEGNGNVYRVIVKNGTIIE